MIDTSAETNELQVGDTAPQLIVELGSLIPSLGSLTFHTYFPGPGLEERLAKSTDSTLRDIFQKAQQLRDLSDNDLPYWESVLAASWSTPNLGVLLDQALSHDATREVSTRFALKTADISATRIKSEIDQLPTGWVLALCSRCEIDGAEWHIPMMDFRCTPSASNLERTRLALGKLGQTSGAILQSGRSYHFYGFQLQNRAEWIDFMARALLLAPFVDARFVAHRMIEGTAVLRISASERKPFLPSIVAIL